MAYKFTEKQDCRQQQMAYALYMMGASCFQKSVCNTKRLETTLYLYYQDMPANRQEKLEERVILDIENKLKEYLPLFEEMQCQASIKKYKDEYHIQFETGFEKLCMVVDKKGRYQIYIEESEIEAEKTVA